jgi:predicted secreted protein
MTGKNGFGTALARGNDAGPEVFANIAGITNISAPSLSRETLDVTGHDSADAAREFRGGLKDGGEVSIDINYDPSVHDVLVADFDDEDPRNYKIVFPDTTEWGFAAIMTGFSPSAPHDDKLSASVTFKVSGMPAITPAD